jgi:inner membrane transporter RhtA
LTRVNGRALSGAAFILAGAVIIQWSAAVIRPVFSSIGPSAASGWRFLTGAIVLLALTRPRVRGWGRDQWVGALVMGVTVAFMNGCFYQAIARIPLGDAVAIEYLGPLLVAALGRRTWRHGALALLAALGVVALARPGGGITLVGALFAAGAGLGWAGYAFASARVGKVTTGFGGLAVAMATSAAVTLPFTIGRAHVVLANGDLLGRAALVGVMAIVVGFGLELLALRRLSPSVVGVLLALDPAAAFLIGWLLLAQPVTGVDALGLAAVMVAGAGVTWDAATGEVALGQ